MDTLNNEERVKYQKRKNQDFILSGTQYPELLRSSLYVQYLDNQKPAQFLFQAFTSSLVSRRICTKFGQ